MITLDRRLPDGDNDNGRGWQCSKYSWYLASGIRMNYAPHPDWGPCNGNEMVDYLVSKAGYVRCGKENGAIFSYNAGENGHTGMVLDASRDLISNANFNYDKRVTTNTINLDARGATYCKPAGAPAPVPVPPPSTLRDATPQDIADIWAGKYGNMPERRQNLINAGINPDNAQARINAGEGAPAPAPVAELNVGDTVVPTKLVSYDGVALKQWDPSYTISEINGDRVVLSARGAVWAAMNSADVRKV